MDDYVKIREQYGTATFQITCECGKVTKFKLADVRIESHTATIGDCAGCGKSLTFRFAPDKWTKADS